MLSTERKPFEDEMAILFGGWPTFLTPPRIEAYWRGLGKMSFDVFKRCVCYALEHASSEQKVPTVGRIWEISRELRQVTAAPKSEEERRPAPSVITAYSNRALWNYLWRKGAASNESLGMIMAAKDKICSSYELICSEEPEASLEIRDKLFGAWDAVWQPITRSELDAAHEKFQKVGHL